MSGRNACKKNFFFFQCVTILAKDGLIYSPFLRVFFLQEFLNVIELNQAFTMTR